MIYQASPIAVVIFAGFVALVLGISFYFGKKTKSAEGYFAAEGKIHWSVNGIAFAGDYLSAASFLGIAGMIATMGYDGFLYSIGYLAGWVVALFVVAEPLKRMGKYTFGDALDSRFNSRGIRLSAAVSTLVVSVCYLIPQMVGAGALVTPLLGLPHYAGVIIVGAIVIFIVATAGMASTTYVQFIKGALLIIFSIVLVAMVLNRGLLLKPSEDYHDFQSVEAGLAGGRIQSVSGGYTVAGEMALGEERFVKLSRDGEDTWWQVTTISGSTATLGEVLSMTVSAGGEQLYNGAPKEDGKFYAVGHLSKIVVDGKEVSATGPLGPFEFLETIQESEVVRFTKRSFTHEGTHVSLWIPTPTSGKQVMRPGLKFKVDEGATFASKLNFVSLMLALFFGTSALPHVLIRYYTVPSPAAARKSTIVAISAIGLFYILTLFMGLGAMVGGVLDVESSNMAAPLLARLFGVPLFAIISAIAFATVLGTVSGLIVAASGAVAHDLFDMLLRIKMSDRTKVRAGKVTAVVVGGIAILLGIAFKGMNVSFLVGWAFAVAASANLPAIMLLLFWKKTTAKGITASIVVGMVSAITIILLSPSMFERYGLNPASAPMPLDNPGIISIPLSFLTLIVVSLLTSRKAAPEPVADRT